MADLVRQESICDIKLDDINYEERTRYFFLIKQLRNLRQGDSTVDSFFQQCKALWHQLDDLDPLLCSGCEGSCTCQQTQRAQREKRRLFDFFTSLRPEFESVCYELLKRPITTSEMISALQMEEARLCSISEQSSVPVPAVAASSVVPTSSTLTQVRELLILGANRMNDKNNQYPLHVAVMKDNCKLAKILLEKHHVDERNFRGRTPLHVALSNGAMLCVTLLNEYSADWYLEDHEGNNAFHIAAHAVQSGGALRFCEDPISFVRNLPRLSAAAKSKRNFRGETPQEILKMVPKDFISKEFGAELRLWGLDPEAGVTSGSFSVYQIPPVEQCKLSDLIAANLVLDANLAGGTMSKKCTLILTEGLSAGLFARCGIDNVLGHDEFGVYALIGKPSNVQTEGTLSTQLLHIMCILGLKIGKKESLDKDLRYGSVMFMVDQDEDGSHIKGLLTNFFRTCFPSLLLLPGFIQDFPTPILLGENARTAEKKLFKTLNEHDCWRHGTTSHEWSFTYLKGLASHNKEATIEYFQNFKSNIRYFYWSGDCDDNHLKLAFKKEMPRERRKWVSQRETMSMPYLDSQLISYTDFVSSELRFYFAADMQRSLPSAIDGLRLTQRKVMYACLEKLERNVLVDVDKLATKISEFSAYRHRQDSMISVIIKMVRNFVGSGNNLSLFVAGGQFGTRHLTTAGKPSYLKTMLSPVARYLFPEDDYGLLEHLNELGVPVEPKLYMPIAPLILINGGKGVGTGHSFDVPSYHPLEVIENVRRLIEDKAPIPMKPWYRDFKGEVCVFNAIKYQTIGSFENCGTTVYIREIPVSKSYDKYKKFLTVLKKQNDIKDFAMKVKEGSTWFEVTLHKESTDSKIEEIFKLKSSVTSQLNLFDVNGNIVTYESAKEVLYHFFEERLKLYTRRKNHLMESIKLKIQHHGTADQDRGELCSRLSSLENKREYEYEFETWRKELDALEQMVRAQYAESGSSLDRA